jgi:hypothetical protein
MTNDYSTVLYYVYIRVRYDGGTDIADFSEKDHGIFSPSHKALCAAWADFLLAITNRTVWLASGVFVTTGGFDERHGLELGFDRIGVLDSQNASYYSILVIFKSGHFPRPRKLLLYAI